MSIADEARPIRSDSGSAERRATARPAAESTQAWRLRWRTPGGSQSLTHAESGEKPMAVSRAVLVWSDAEAGTRSAVRQAAQVTPVNPFQDPFSDKPTPAPAQPSDQPALPPLDSAPNLDAPTLPPSVGNPPVPAPAEESAPIPPSTLDTAPSDAAPIPPGSSRSRDLPPSDPLELPNGLDPSGGQKPCQRTYNGRDCCVDGEKCRDARRFVKEDTITKIGIDITPAFTNLERDTPTDVVQSRDLALAPSRIWKDRSGSQVAEGRLVDFRFGRVHIAGTDGQTAQIPFKELSDDDLCFVTAWWSLPTECLLDADDYSHRNWLATTMMWKASALCHKPLYFEDVQLERYGHTSGPITEPFVSAAHFFTSFVTLPYQMGIHPPQECMYSLGYYRPGSCAPWLVPPIPLSIRGGLAQAGAIVGGIYVIP
ncbi:MAG: SHD1 domain-containing protein [Pirellulaceae bacterium]